MVNSLSWLKTKWQQGREIMARNPELGSLLFALVLSGIVSHLDNPSGSRLHVSYSQPLPPKLFHPPVIEFTTGDLGAVNAVIGSTGAEIWIIMYYAHWDANSLETAQEFEEAARLMSGQVLFMAVNCWFPAGACRQKVTIPFYPVIFAHRDSREGIQYTGLQRASEIMEFIKRVSSPVQYVPDTQSLWRLRALHDTIAVTYFSFEESPDPDGLASFQKAALLQLEKDPIQPTPFAVITSKHLASSLGLAHARSLTLLRNFNASLNYPSTELFKSRHIVNWVTHHRESLLQWIAPPGLKSTILSSQVLHEPTLLLFTPHRHDDTFASNYVMLREVTMEYYNCNNKSSILNKLVEQIRIERERIASRGLQGKPSPKCSPESRCQDDDASSSKSDCCQTLASRGRIESITTVRSNVCEICETFKQPLHLSHDPCSYQTMRARSPVLLDVTDAVTASSNACLYINNFYSPYSHYRLCCQDLSHVTCGLCPPLLSQGTLYGSRGSFDRSRTNAHYSCTDCRTIDCQRDSQCLSESCGDCKHIPEMQSKSASNTHQERSSKIAAQNAEHFDEPFYRQKLDRDFLGLGCRTNRTLSFRAMRSEYFWSMADRLGLKQSSDSDNKRNESLGIAIVDIQDETHHILQLDKSALSMATFKQFIVNYTESNLPRQTQSLRAPPSNTIDACLDASNTVCITEVTADTFNDLVLDTKKDVLLLYYAPWCGACLRIHHIFLQLVSIFQTQSNTLRIARINADTNDLPWHLIAPSYPTILFFPGGSKADSVKYPVQKAVTLPNLVEFVLQNIHLPTTGSSDS